MPIGTVSVVFGSRCEVLDGGRPVPCLLRGRLRQAAGSLAVGDQVEYASLGGGQGVVERLLDRRNEISRSNRERNRRSAPGAYPRQVVLANPDQVVFVAAARNPGLDFPLMDRALALARSARLPSAICVNKMDLAPEREILRLMAPYERLGVPVLYASAEERHGLEALRTLLAGKLSFFWGGSGVGKSSLIRALTDFDLKIGRWRDDNPRGPHTTNVTRLYPLPSGGLIADTPGFDWLALDTVEEAPDAVDHLLPEAAALSSRCRFPGCTHCGEPDCAVMQAVLLGEIDRGRYARFRQEVAEGEPPHAPAAEVHSTGEELFFRERQGNAYVWTTFTMHHLFSEANPERGAFLERLGVPLGAGEPGWVVFQEKAAARASQRSFFTAKLTARLPVEAVVRDGEEVILRERGVVKGLGTVRDLRPAATTWQMRKALKHTPIYESRALWSEVKPPKGVVMPQVFGATLKIGRILRFEPLPTLAMGAVTRQEIGLVLDFLEIGSSEDELARQ
jgi:ribosome biogenesis GTPase